MYEATPAELVTIMQHCIASRVLLTVHSAPGLGKTSIAKQVADDPANPRKLFYLSAPTMEPTDLYLRARPNPNTRQVEFTPPEFKTHVSSPSLLVIDEANRGSVMLQNSILHVAFDVTGEERPLNCAMVMLANISGTGTTKLIDPLVGRGMHVRLKADLPSWRQWAASQHVGFAPILAYLGDHPTSLHPASLDPNYATARRTTQANGAAAHVEPEPGPRPWEFVANLLNASLPPTLERAMLAGTIGEAETSQFWPYLDLYRKLATRFNIDALLMDPTQYQVPAPDQPSLAYAITSALAARATPTNFGRIIQYVSRLPGEYQVFAVRGATRARPDPNTGVPTPQEQARVQALQTTPEYTRWCIANQDAL